MATAHEAMRPAADDSVPPAHPQAAAVDVDTNEQLVQPTSEAGIATTDDSAQKASEEAAIESSAAQQPAEPGPTQTEPAAEHQHVAEETIVEPTVDGQSVVKQAVEPIVELPAESTMPAPARDPSPVTRDSPTEDAAQQLMALGAVPMSASDAQAPPSPIPSSSTVPPTPVTATNAEASTSSSPAVMLQGMPVSANLQKPFVPTYPCDPPAGPWSDADDFKRSWREWAASCDPPQKLIVRGCASYGSGSHGRNGGYVELSCSFRHVTGGKGCPFMIRSGQKIGEGPKGP